MTLFSLKCCRILCWNYLCLDFFDWETFITCSFSLRGFRFIHLEVFVCLFFAECRVLKCDLRIRGGGFPCCLLCPFLVSDLVCIFCHCHLVVQIKECLSWLIQRTSFALFIHWIIVFVYFTDFSLKFAYSLMSTPLGCFCTIFFWSFLMFCWVAI